MWKRKYDEHIQVYLKVKLNRRNTFFFSLFNPQQGEGLLRPTEKRDNVTEEKCF